MAKLNVGITRVSYRALEDYFCEKGHRVLEIRPSEHYRELEIVVEGPKMPEVREGEILQLVRPMLR